MKENLKLLIDKLKVKAIAKQAIWAKTSRDNEYKLQLSKGAITVDSWFNDGSQYYDLTVLNDQGDKVDYLQVSDTIEDYWELKELHDLIIEGYYRVDETFKSIFDELDSNKTIGADDDLPF